jgi:hypothetical protein
MSSSPSDDGQLQACGKANRPLKSPSHIRFHKHPNNFLKAFKKIQHEFAGIVRFDEDLRERRCRPVRVDIMITRHCYCPASLCLGEGLLAKKPVRWYKPVLRAQFCASYGTRLKPHFRHTVWIAAALWFAMDSRADLCLSSTTESSPCRIP